MTNVNFIICGRLGNAIFRYFACSLLCILYKGTYTINNLEKCNFDDKHFSILSNMLLNNISIPNNIPSVNMLGYYQHCKIYKLNKNNILYFMKNHTEHYVLTDGINAGDGNHQKFFIKDIINTPENFIKKYKNVLHLRLEDFVKHNLYIPKERIIDLIKKSIVNIIKEPLCIVLNKPTTDFEEYYLKCITDVLKEYNVSVVIESNDVLTDFHIMKEADLLICSMSTLSWCAAFLSTNIKICYLPNYESQTHMDCKYPIDNTFLY